MPSAPVTASAGSGNAQSKRKKGAAQGRGLAEPALTRARTTAAGARGRHRGPSPHDKGKNCSATHRPWDIHFIAKRASCDPVRAAAKRWWTSPAGSRSARSQTRAGRVSSSWAISADRRNEPILDSRMHRSARRSPPPEPETVQPRRSRRKAYSAHNRHPAYRRPRRKHNRRQLFSGPMDRRATPGAPSIPEAGARPCLHEASLSPTTPARPAATQAEHARAPATSSSRKSGRRLSTPALAHAAPRDSAQRGASPPRADRFAVLAAPKGTFEWALTHGPAPSETALASTPHPTSEPPLLLPNVRDPDWPPRGRNPESNLGPLDLGPTLDPLRKTTTPQPMHTECISSAM